jgi:hypothetical protein
MPRREWQIFLLYITGTLLGLTAAGLFMGAAAGATDDESSTWSQPEVRHALTLMALAGVGSIACFAWAWTLRRRRGR